MKKFMMYGMMGGLMVLGYLKYKDGTIERTVKNMIPMLNTALDDLKR